MDQSLKPAAVEAANRLRETLIAQGLSQPTVGTGNVGTSSEPVWGLFVYLSEKTYARLTDKPEIFEDYPVRWRTAVRAHAVGGFEAQ